MIPDLFAQSTAPVYHALRFTSVYGAGADFEVSASSIRESTVTSIARVIVVSGENLFFEVPLK